MRIKVTTITKYFQKKVGIKNLMHNIFKWMFVYYIVLYIHRIDVSKGINVNK